MGMWTTMKVSYQARGVHLPNLPWNPSGSKASYARMIGGKIPQEGLLHSMKSGIADMADLGNDGGIVLSRKGIHRYGGNILSRGGINEIRYGAKKIGQSGYYALGARRTLGGALTKLAGKTLWPGIFAYQIYNEGLYTASKDAVVMGGAWGAGKWTLSRLALGMPIIAGIAAIAGTAIGARATLIAGQEYNRSMRKVNFGATSTDPFGQMRKARQASLSAIQSSKINGSSALGREAQLLHY